MSHHGHVQHTHGPHWTGVHHSRDLIKGDEHNGFHISAKALDKTWGNDQRFWQWVHLDKKELSKIKLQQDAELTQVNWVEVKGKLDAAKLSPGKTFEVLYMIKFKIDAFGSHSSHITFQVMTLPPQGHKNRKTEILEQYGGKKGNAWLNLTSNDGGNMEFGMSGDGSE